MGKRIAEVVALFETQAAAAEVAGVTATQLRRWMSGDGGSPSVIALAALASARSVSLDWLVFGTGSMKGPSVRAKDSPAFAALSEELVESWAGGTTTRGKVGGREVVDAMGRLTRAGMFEAFADAGWSLDDEDAVVVLEIVREVAAVMPSGGELERSRAAEVAVAAQRTALAHASKAPPKKHSPK